VPPLPASTGAAAGSVAAFELSLPGIDRLMALLFELSNYNPDFMRMHLKSEHAVTCHNLHNTSPMLTLPANRSIGTTDKEIRPPIESLAARH
jgi:hypothetical protein